jgi:hypothetical protein
MGNAMKTIWFCVLLSLLSIVAYRGISDALSEAGPANGASTSSSPIRTQPSDTPVGPVALDSFTRGQAPGAEGNNANPSARLSEYLFLHRIRNERIAARTAASSFTCPE